MAGARWLAVRSAAVNAKASSCNQMTGSGCRSFSGYHRTSAAGNGPSIDASRRLNTVAPRHAGVPVHWDSLMSRRAASQDADTTPPFVLGTKVAPPPARPEHIDRERLFERLDQATTRPLTLVAAPTGFGKTTLLSAWARRGTRAHGVGRHHGRRQ